VSDWIQAMSAAVNAVREPADESAILRAENAALREALEEIGNVLGTGACNLCDCAGCEFEMKEAVRLVKDALGPQDAPRTPNPSPDPAESATGHESAGEGETS